LWKNDEELGEKIKLTLSKAASDSILSKKASK